MRYRSMDWVVWDRRRYVWERDMDGGGIALCSKNEAR